MTSRIECMVIPPCSSVRRLARTSSDSLLRISRTRALRVAGLVLLARPLLLGGRVTAQTVRGSKVEKPLVSFTLCHVTQAIRSPPKSW